MTLDDNVKYLKGVGPKRAELLKKLGIHTVRDVLYHLPRQYQDFTAPVDISSAVLDEVNVLRLHIVKKYSPDLIRKNMRIYKILATDGADDITIVIFNSVYLFNTLREGQEYIICGKVTGDLLRREISSPVVLDAGSPDRILPIYPLTDGISLSIMRKLVKNALEVSSGFSLEFVPSGITEGLSLISEDAAIAQIHFPESQTMISQSRRRLAFDELLVLQLGMLKLREANRSLTSYALCHKRIDAYYRALPFDLTGAQKLAIEECCTDMERSVPMNRLVLGDVGSGKTAVAAACCYFAFLNGVQSCLMAPTEILADQHYATLTKFLDPLGVRIALLKGSLSQKVKSAIKSGLANGEYDIAVGTHALLEQSTEFKDLALVITDEQHRFGVNQRDQLANKGRNPHRLLMSATPIPRTLALMIYGELDISILNEMPKGRLPTKTYAITGKLRDRAYGFIADRLREGRQAYIVCPAIDETQGISLKDVTGYADSLKKGVLSDFTIEVLHGRMVSDKKDAVMRRFKDGKTDILVSTTVVEVGVDVPNAAVMLIENADRFGLSQLHQLRGRVGRGNEQSYCILVTDNVTPDSKQRLRALTASSNGFEISETDLKLRGPGDFFGESQHGLPRLKIADLAADTDLVNSSREAAESMIRNGYLDTSQGKELVRRVKLLLNGGIKG